MAPVTGRSLGGSTGRYDSPIHCLGNFTLPEAAEVSSLRSTLLAALVLPSIGAVKGAVTTCCAGLFLFERRPEYHNSFHRNNGLPSDLELPVKQSDSRVAETVIDSHLL